ncbi:hypothetical protein NPIL_61561 [Nephila pilipes]|uniref:Uncharacterized protein n=1 Tax=Nephila pilipes TaxID=299642 RepID=A0A8X6MNS6_NEPPI|nr:hypothetical protein NPIL_61561 [Nephila pilipes]
MEREHSMEFVGNYNDVEISVTAWKDNKTVIMASTFAGEKALRKVMRYDKKIKNPVEITKASCHRRIYRTYGRSSYCKCMVKYKRVETDKKSEYKKNLMNLQKFKSEVASCLCKMGYNQKAKRGRPGNTSIKQMFQTKRWKGIAQSVPCKDIRRDGINLWPIWSEK